MKTQGCTHQIETMTLEVGKMTYQEQIEAEKIIHEYADHIKMSHGGWWESYADSFELRVVALSESIKARQIK